MTQMSNPFKPTAGKNPPELIGRDDVIVEFTDGLDNGPGAPGRLLRITGMRGMGKTVMLNELASIAKSRGWTIVTETASEGFVERILHRLEPRYEVRGTVEPELLGFKLGSVELAKNAVSLREAMARAAGAGSGLLITLDEVQDASIAEIRTLAIAVQHLIRDDANIAFVFAGLHSMVDGVVNSESLTFLRRAVPFTLGPLNAYEVADSLDDTFSELNVSVSRAVVDYLADASAGYPFMVQLVGYYSWQKAARRHPGTLDEEDASEGVSLARSRFDETVIEPALHHLPPMQVRYLLAMAQDGGEASSTRAVSDRMGKGASDVAPYRDRLVKAGIIEASAWGKVRFAIPNMADYLENHREEIEREISEA